jgi:transposase
MTGIHAYDHIDLPPIRPIVTASTAIVASALVAASRYRPRTEGFEPRSPFGPGIEALIIHLHITQAVSFERLSRLMAEVFALSISEGAIANILAVPRRRWPPPWRPLPPRCAQAPVGSDETSARVRGKTWWQWVLLSSTAICHVIADTRAASVVTEFLQGGSPRFGSRIAMADSWAMV